MKDDFLWFIKERNAIRFKKDIGFPKPFAKDYILANTHFLNIDPYQDPGTIRLHHFIDGMTDWEKLFYIFIYRACYSGSKTLQRMTGIWIHDLRNIRMLEDWIYICNQPYSFRIGRNNSIKQFIDTIIYPSLKEFYLQFDDMHESSILEVEELLWSIFFLRMGLKQKLLSSILANDLALQFPSKINPDSICYFSLSASHILRKLPGRAESRIEDLRKQTGLNYSSLNRALNEFYKYRKRKEYFEEKGCLREEWLHVFKSL